LVSIVVDFFCSTRWKKRKKGEKLKWPLVAYDIGPHDH
jgi:hypothetical protein